VGAAAVLTMVGGWASPPPQALRKVALAIAAANC
jgi:hypothetical protein